ncbi:hypothetical protein MKS88_005187 [Plasmodium brasilianum]|uniref:Uncharacterized protein n=1 Tax=Plasmodium brasilianum TaxID=5824 RepID=A0ACB9Y671_PLABR|nr:hypothetical protein MKS88_005187 [Plasmodium brasilianum]
MKRNCLYVLKLLKNKKCNAECIANDSNYSKRYCSGNITENRGKIINHISYSLPMENNNEKYNFELLMKTIKNRADEYNLIKIKEVQNKILIHLKKFTINEVVSTLILSFKYNLLNTKILFEITEQLFQNSCFLNSKHLYILVSIMKKIHLEKCGCLLNQTNDKNRIYKTENILQHVNETIGWKKKYYKEVYENIFSDSTPDPKLKENGNTQFNDDDISNTSSYVAINALLCNHANLTSEKQQNDVEGNGITSYDRSEKGDEISVEKLIFNQDDISTYMKKTYFKIKNILTHNYINISLNMKNNMYTNLLLLNYLHEENIINGNDFLKIIYSINMEFDEYSFISNSSNYYYNGYNNCTLDNSWFHADNITNSYIQEQGDNESTYDLYIQVHFNLLKNLLKRSYIINDIFILEKMENGITIENESYKNKKLYLDTFTCFFNNLIRVQKNINYIKLFYLNIMSYEIFKLFTDNEVYKNVKIHYVFLKRVKCETILREKIKPNINYYFLSIIYYLKREHILNYKMDLFQDHLLDLTKIHNKYILFLNSLSKYNLCDICVDNHRSNTSNNVNLKYNEQTVSSEHNINMKSKDINNKREREKLQSNELKNTCFCYYMVEFTFNIVCYLNSIDICEQIFILKYLVLLNFKNEYLIDIINQHVYNFFILKSYYTDPKYFYYILEYLFISLIYSPPTFFNIICLIDHGKFQNLLDNSLGGKKKITHKVKKIYDTVNTIMNTNEKNAHKNNFNKSSIIISYNDKQVRSFQNLLYDFIFL